MYPERPPGEAMPSSPPAVPASYPLQAYPVAPTAGYPVTAVPPGYPLASSAPPAASGAPPTRRAGVSIGLALQIVVAILLASGLVAIGILGLGRIGELEDEATALHSEADAREATAVAAAQKIESDFVAADLPGRLKVVKGLDKVADTQFEQWKDRKVAYGDVRAAILACEDEADAYNRAAATFPAAKFSAVLPQRIDLSDRETDCGRGFTSRI